MDGFFRRWLARSLWVACAAVAVAAGCARPVPVEELPPAESTMTSVGRRLGHALSAAELTALARRGARLLPRLTGAERSALARTGLRFLVNEPVTVEVATAVQSAPFWLEDLGFQRLTQPLPVAGADWSLFGKDFPPGWVGLGVNGLDRTPRAHYVVFVRPQGPRPAAAPMLSANDREHWRILTAFDGVSAAWDLERPLGPLPERLRGAVLLQPAYARRHATLLAPSRVWKTHVPSGPAPDQIAIALGPDPAHGLVWTWRTDPTVRTSRVCVQPLRAPAPGRDSPILTREGESELVPSPTVLNDPAMRRHQVTVTGLKPDTLYRYSVGNDSPEGRSPWYITRTAPELPRSFRFLYMGDPQCGLEEWGKLLSAARRRHPDAAFLLIAGDLVDRGNERTNWDHFFLRAAGVFEELPVMPCVGNHEYLDQGPRLYRAFFTLPPNGPEGIDTDLVYSFEYGNALIAVLDSTLALSDPASARQQAEWLDGALRKTSAAWKLVMFHHPVYASHPQRESPALAAAWVPVFDRHHVDLVLQGHDHAYLRTYPLRAGERTERPDEGTTYVVSVSGTKYYDQRDRAETAVGRTGLSTYQTIDIDVPGQRLIYRAWDGAGRAVDSFVIEKRAVAPAVRGATGGGREAP